MVFSSGFKCLALSILSIMLLASPANAFLLDNEEIGRLQSSLSTQEKGERIAAWAERFVGTPYDPDPNGLYVTTRRIVADESVDCMYHTFRSVELALTNTPGEAAALALRLRFHTGGVIGDDGLVQNYDERYQYAMDMVRGGRWGEDVTSTLGGTLSVRGERGLNHVDILPRDGIPKSLDRMRSGDIVFFVKDPEKRVVGEIVGHLGILKREGDEVYLIHASGRKNRGGRVAKVPFGSYTANMPFVGIMVTRFESKSPAP